jgi:hypothetical protein
MAKVDNKEYKAHGLLDQLENKVPTICMASKPWEDILAIYQGRSCGKSAFQTVLEENEKRLREIAELSAPKLELPLVEEYTKPDGTKAKRPKAHPYVPTFLPWLDVSPCIRYDPAKAFLLGPDLAADPDRLNIQVKCKHNKLKFNFNN